jgi:hypothetical protein
MMDAKDKTTPTFRYSATIIGNTANHVPLLKSKPAPYSISVRDIFPNLDNSITVSS